MSKLILAEKPSVARDIAKVVGATEFEKLKAISVNKGNGYIVTSFLGHLVDLAEPEFYNPVWQNRWDLNTLPITVAENQWQFCAKSAEGKNYALMLEDLKNLMFSDEVDSLICATDAAREGVTIFRYVYDFLGCKKSYDHLWISSLTEESIREGMKNLIPSENKLTVFNAGFTRNRADWLVGLNLSRLFSIHCGAFFVYGRVQTPTLAMIVNRDNEIANFSKSKYYALSLENSAEFYDETAENNTFSDKSKAEKIATECKGKMAKVIKAESKEKQENRPLLHSLTSLQKEANDKHGLTANRTLEAAQGLYEKKLTTYPRTDSNYISEDMKETVNVVCGVLTSFDEARLSKLITQGLNLDNRVINNAKISDHHAIIPTKEVWKFKGESLSLDEKTVLNLIINRFLCAVDLPHVYNETQTIFEVADYKFKLVSKQTIKLGWKEYSQNENEGETKKNNKAYAEGENFLVEKVIVSEKQTTPPKAYTESTLLSSMENISKKIDDKEKREFVKERGLGTPATRAGIIESLIAYKYIQRQGKNLIATEAGKTFISLLPEKLTTPETTADLEQLLFDIEEGKTSAESVISEINTLIRDIIQGEKEKEHVNLRNIQNQMGKCPKCGKNVVNWEDNYCCENFKICGFKIYKNNKFWSDILKHKFTDDLFKKMLENGKVRINKLHDDKYNYDYDAYISFDSYTKDCKTRVGFKSDRIKKPKND